MRLLITTDELHYEIASHNRNVIILDCRHNPRDFSWGRRQYNSSHIPTAQHLHLKDDLSGDSDGYNGRHPLPDVRKLSQGLRELAMTRRRRIVLYDDSGGNYAARCWWVLRWLGCQRVSILDGGWHKWLSEELPVSDRPYPKDDIGFNENADLRVNNDLCVDDTFIGNVLDDANFSLIDARHPDAFNGIHEWQDPIAGHMPGAVNHFYKWNLNEDGTFKTAAELRKTFNGLIQGVAPQNVIHSCGSGVNACGNIVAMELAGLAGSRLYPGSWSEWCSDEARPMVRFR